MAATERFMMKQPPHPHPPLFISSSVIECRDPREDAGQNTDHISFCGWLLP